MRIQQGPSSKEGIKLMTNYKHNVMNDIWLWGAIKKDMFGRGNQTKKEKKINKEKVYMKKGTREWYVWCGV